MFERSNKQNSSYWTHGEWTSATYREKLCEKVLYATSQTRCLKITRNSVEDAEELHCDHEEADTRVVLHARHASLSHYKSVVIASEDTDVRLLCMAFSNQVLVPIYQKCKTATKTSFIDITNVSLVQGQAVSRALPSFHAFTGCDSVCREGKEDWT